MTKTPRTDAAEQEQNILNQGIPDKNWPWEAIKSGYNFARQLEEENNNMREAIREAHTQIRYAEASFAGLALRLHPNDPSNDVVLTRTKAALAKLQPFLQ
jgi:hypothetical protein